MNRFLRYFSINITKSHYLQFLIKLIISVKLVIETAVNIYVILTAVTKSMEQTIDIFQL